MFAPTHVRFADLEHIQYLTGVGQRYLAVEDHSQVIAHLIIGAFFDIGVDDQCFTYEKVSVSRVRYLQ